MAYEDIDFGSIIGDRANLYETADGRRFMATDAEKQDAFDSLGLTRQKRVTYKGKDGYEHILSVDDGFEPDDAWMAEHDVAKVTGAELPENYVYRVNTYALPDGNLTTVREDQEEGFRDWATKTYGVQPTLQTHARVNGIYVSGANDQINEVLRMAREQEAGLTAEQLAAIGVTEEMANAGIGEMVASKDTLENRIKRMGEVGFLEAESHDRGYRKLGHEAKDEWDATKATLATGLDIATGLLDIGTLGFADVVRTPEVMIQVYGNPETGLQALKDRSWLNKQADLARMAIGDAEYDELSSMSDEQLHEYFKRLLLEQRKSEYIDSLRGRTTGANVGTTITGTAESGLDFWASTAAGSAAGAGLGAAVGTVAPGLGNAIGGLAGAAGGAVAGATGYLLSHAASERDVAKTSKMAFDPITGKLVEYAPGMEDRRAAVAGIVNPLVEWGVERVGGKIGGKLMKPVKGGLAKAIGRDRAILFGIMPGVTSKPADKGLAKLAERAAVNFRRFAKADTWTGKLVSMTGNAASRMTPAAIGGEVFEEYLQAAIEGGLNLRGELVDEYGELARADIGNAGAAVLDVIKQTPELAMGIALYGVGSGMAVRGAHALMDGYATRITMRKGLEKLGYTAKQLKNMKTEDMKRVFMEKLDAKGDEAVKIAKTITKGMSEEELKKMAEAATGHKAEEVKTNIGVRGVRFGDRGNIVLDNRGLSEAYKEIILDAVEENGLYAVTMNEKVDDVTRAALHMAKERTADIRRAVQEMGADKAFAGWGNSAEVYDSLSQALALRMASTSAQFSGTPYGRFLHYAADVAERTALAQAVGLYGKREAIRFMGEFNKYTLGGDVILPGAGVEVEQVFKGDKDRKEGDPQWEREADGAMAMRHGGVYVYHKGDGRYKVGLDETRKGGLRIYESEDAALRYANRLHAGVVESEKRMNALKERANQMYDEMFGNEDGLERGMVVLSSPFEDPRVAQEMLEMLTRDGTMSDEKAVDALRTAKGVRLNNGRFYVFLQNATSLADLAATIRHEGFHAGLNETVGNDSDKISAFIKEAREVIRGSGARVVDMLGDDTTEDAIDKMSERERRIALDETLAALAEVVSKKPGMRGRVATAVNKFFHGGKQHLAGLDADEKMQEAQNIITDAFMRVHGFAKEDEAKVEKDKERAREWLKKFKARVEGRRKPPAPPAPPAEPDAPGPEAPTPGPTPPTPLTPAPTSTPAEPTKPPVPTPVPVPTVANGEKDADGNIVWRRRRLRFAVRNGKPGVWVHDTDNKGRTKPGMSFYEFRKPFKSKKGRTHYGWLDDNGGRLKFAGAIWNDLDAWAAAGHPGLEAEQMPRFDANTGSPRTLNGGKVDTPQTNTDEPWGVVNGEPVTMPDPEPLRFNAQALDAGVPIETFGELEPSQVASETWRSYRAPMGMGYVLERVQDGKDGKIYTTVYAMLQDDFEWFRTNRSVYDRSTDVSIDVEYNSPASDRVTQAVSWRQNGGGGARVRHGYSISFGDDGKVVSRKEFFAGFEQDRLPGMDGNADVAPSKPTPEAPTPPAPTPEPAPEPEPTPTPAPEPTPTESPAQDDLFGDTGTQEGGKLTSATNVLFGDEEVPVEDVDVDKLAVNDRIKQFKENADHKTGVVAGEQLTGEFSPSIARPIRVMRFKDGHLEVITGRHRLDLARRKGVKSIKAFIYDEADGMTIDMARSIDALENIKDGKGSEQDFIRFFRDTKLDEEAIRMTGFRESGRRDAKDAWDIVSNGIEDVVSYALDRNQTLVSIRVLAAIARCDKRVQRAVLDTVLKDKSGIMQDPVAVERFGLALASGLSDSSAEQDSLFGEDDPAIEEAKMVGIGAAAFVKDLAQDKIAVSNAINRGDKLTLNTDTMARLGVTDAHDKAQLKAAYDKLSAEIAEWQKPTLSGEMRQRALERGRAIERKRTGGYTQTGLFGRPSTPQSPTAPTEPQTPAPAPAAPKSKHEVKVESKPPVAPTGLKEDGTPVTKPPADPLRFNFQARVAGYGVDVFGEAKKSEVVNEFWATIGDSLGHRQETKDGKVYFTSYVWNANSGSWERSMRSVEDGDNMTVVAYTPGPMQRASSVWNMKRDESGEFTVYHGTRIKFGKNGRISAREELNPDGSVKAATPTTEPTSTSDSSTPSDTQVPDEDKEPYVRAIRTIRKAINDRDSLKAIHERIREFSNKWRGFVDKLFALSEAYKKTGNETNDRYGSNITAEERWDGSSIYQSYYAENAYEHAIAFMLNAFRKDAYGRRRSDDEILEYALRAVDEFPIMPITKKPENPGEVDLRHGGAMLDIRSDADKFIASTSPYEDRWGQWAVPHSLFMDESGNVVASNSETAKQNMKDYLRFAWALRKFKEEKHNFYSSVPHSETRIPGTFPSFTDYKILYTVTDLDERKNIEALISKRNPWIMALLDKYGVAPVVEDHAWARVLDLAAQEDVDALEAAIDSAVAQTQTQVQQSGTVAQTNERGFDPATYDWSKGERSGRGVTVDDFKSTFGFDDVNIADTFVGKDIANAVYDGFVALARKLNIPYEAISLGGVINYISLGYDAQGGIAGAFNRMGAKDGSWATRGLIIQHPLDAEGSLNTESDTPEVRAAKWESFAAHEWMHALDHILVLGKDMKPRTGQIDQMLSRGDFDNVRPEVKASFREMREAVLNSKWGREQDETTSGYEDTPWEILARAMEGYMAAEDNSRYGDTFNEEGGPHPNAEQTAEFAPAMERFFQTLRVGTNASSGKTTLFKLGKEAFPEAPRSTLKDRVEIRGAMAVPFAGSKASVIEDYPELFRGIGNAAKEAGGRIIDAFAGAGAYTAGLGALDALPRGSVLNEWAVSRYVMHKILAENPEAMARAAEDIATRFVNSPEMAEVRRRVEQANKDGKHVVNLAKPVIDWFYDELNGKHGTIYVDGTDNTEFGDAALRETPESAALYQVLQSIVSSGYPVNFVWKKGELKIDVAGGNFRAGQVGRIAEKNGKTNKWRMSKPGEGVFNVQRYPQRILNTGRIYQQNGVQVTRGDGWALAKTARRGDVVLVDPAYLGTQSYGGKKNVDANDANNKDIAIAKLVDLVKWADANGVSVVYTNEFSDKSGMGGMSRADYEAVWREALDKIGSDGVAVNVFDRKAHGMRGSQAPRADIVFATGRVARLFNVSNAELDSIKAQHGFETDEEAEDRAYLDAVERGDTEAARRMVEERARKMGVENPIPEQTDAYKVRVSAPPKKTIKVYKVFTIDQAGRPTALFVSGMDALPMGVWLDAQDTWHFTAKNGKQYIPSTANPNGRGGKTGTAVEIPDEATRQELIKRGFLPQGSKAKTVVALAYRPGWHAGDMPFFPQGGVKRAGSNYGNVHHARQVVFECEMDADHDYTEEARNQPKARTKDGRVNEANADLQSMPDGGFYRYSTNPLTKGGKRGTWFISGSLKINRALTQEEADRILQENGFAPQEWEQGELDLAQLGYRGDESEAARKTLAPVTYDDNGNVIPLSQRFNPENPDIRFKTGTAETDADIRFKRASAEAASSFVAREMERLTGKKWGERAKAAKDGGSRFLKWAEESFINAQAPVFRWYRSVMAHVPKDKVDDRLNIEAIIKNEPGRIRNEREQLRKNYVDRINKILSENYCDYDKFSDYLYALYVPEREAMVNARLVKQDKDGAIIFPEDPITGEIITPENSSFSGHTMEWAREKVDEVENVLPNGAAYKEAARLVHEMNRKTLVRLVKAGMMTQEQMEAWLEENPHYVPLRDVDSFEKSGARFTTRVTGRTLENPANANTWAASVYQAMNAISISVRNETKQKVVAWAHLYANGEGGIKFAIIDEPKTEKFVSAEAPIYIEKGDPKYRQLEDLGVILVPSADGKGAYVYSGGSRGEASKGHLGVHVRNRTKQGNNMVVVKVDGKRRFLIFDAGPASRRDSEPTRRERYNRIGDERFNSLRVAEALNDANKLRFDMPLVQAMTRFKARVSTSWNPNFIVGNLPIDMINTATIMMMEGRYDDLGRFVKNFGSALRTVYQMRRGKKVADKAMLDALNEALEHGMMTGTFGQSFHDTDADMKRAIEDSLGGSGGIAGMNKAMRGARKLTEWLDTASNITELATRLAAYKAVRDGGMGANEAAQYGREITVDFNANGNYTPVINTLYMFSNAAAQAFIRYVDAAKRGASARGGGFNGWAQTLSMPIAINMAIGFLAALWADGDDDEGAGGEDDSTLLRIPDYVWEGGAPIRLPFGDSYINVPMRGAFVPFMKAGRDLYLLGKGKKEEGEVVGSFLTGLAESTVNIFGKSPDFAQFIAPTIMDPMVQHWTGKDWTGRDLYRRDFGTAGSDAHMGLDRTPSVYHGIAKGLNAITGGDEVEGGLVDVRPETLKLLTDFFAGSLAGQAMTVTGIPGKLMKGEFDANDVPALGRFVRSTPDVANRYYQAMSKAKDEEKVYRKRLSEAKNSTDIADRKRNLEAAHEMAAEHPWLKSVKSMGALQRRISERRDRSKEMEDGPRKEAFDKETERLMGTWLRVYERR